MLMELRNFACVHRSSWVSVAKPEIRPEVLEQYEPWPESYSIRTPVLLEGLLCLQSAASSFKIAYLACFFGQVVFHLSCRYIALTVGF